MGPETRLRAADASVWQRAAHLRSRRPRPRRGPVWRLAPHHRQGRQDPRGSGSSGRRRGGGCLPRQLSA